MSFLGQAEEYQVEQVAGGLEVSPGDIVRRMIEAAFSHQEEKRLFLDMLALYHDMGGERAAKLLFIIDNVDNAEPGQTRILFPDTLRNYIVHGVAPLQQWRMLQKEWPSGFVPLPDFDPPVDYVLPAPQTTVSRPFYETATPEEWSREFLAWAESHHDLPQLPPQAYDRAYFYEEGR